MFGEKKNLKDPEQKSMTSYGTNSQSMSVVLSYTKTNKLVTALYMVTDMIDREEPIRNKLRALGSEIISDIHTMPIARTVLATSIEEIMSFLDIASAIGFISEMNCSILKKEFIELKESIQESNIKPAWLEEFFQGSSHIGHAELVKGQPIRTRIGVQKGSTLMKALSDKTRLMSDSSELRSNTLNPDSHTRDFDMLKKQRRYNITNVIKNNAEGSTIKDIKAKVNYGVEETLICSEKTLQRELVSMIKDGVLYKTGEKRWSRYFMKKT
ncbi:MAG: hypothetical protein NTZ87_04430 [Candidatus Nomurabacteria bacterium]|nr:hypothetical protein [Candidatus Nomurabacteria bacterium]